MIKCGLIGLGRSGWDIHLKCIKNNNNFLLSSISDNNSDRLNEAVKDIDCKGFLDYNELIKDSNIDLIIIATPSKTHFQIAKKALKAKKHVLIEIPITSTINEALELKELAKESKKHLIPFYNFRFADEFLKIQSILNDNIIGVPFLIKRQVAYFNRRNDWQSMKINQGGILNAAAIHHIDQALQLVNDKPIDIWSDLKHLVSRGDAPDHCKIIMRFPSGCVADIEVSWAMSIEESKPWQIFGPRGTISQSKNTLICRWYDKKEITKNVKGERSYLSNETINWKEDTFMLQEDYLLGKVPILYDKIADCINKNLEIPITVDSALIAMEIIKIIEDQNKI